MRNCIFGNKAREDRVSCLAAQLSWSRLAPAERCDMSKKSFDDCGQGLGRREVGNKPLAIIDKTPADR
jgi:hypothetical protein